MMGTLDAISWLAMWIATGAVSVILLFVVVLLLLALITCVATIWSGYFRFGGIESEHVIAAVFFLPFVMLLLSGVIGLSAEFAKKVVKTQFNQEVDSGRQTD